MIRSLSVWTGFDPQEAAAYAVARRSFQHHMPRFVPLRGVNLEALRAHGLYSRPTETRVHPKTGKAQLWDVISGYWMSTEFAISRFLVPALVRSEEWALFTDSDVMVRRPLFEALANAIGDGTKALYCVKHDHQPTADTKMGGVNQSAYERKNWSSVMLFNIHHPANRALTPELVNSVPGRDLHAFCWLKDDEIGALGPRWNYLVGEQPDPGDPLIVHYTAGTPLYPEHANAPYADEWRQWLREWAWAA